MKILHLVYMGKNGGSNIAQKYLSYLKGYNQFEDFEYNLVLINPLPYNTELIEKLKEIKKNLYIVQAKVMQEKCLLLRLILKTRSNVLSLINDAEPDVIFYRADMVSSFSMFLANRYPFIVEYPFIPLNDYLHSRPLYLRLAKKYNQKIVEKSEYVIATLNVFAKDVDIKEKLILLPNTADIEKYDPIDSFTTLDNGINVLLLASEYTLEHFNGYDRFLKGLDSYIGNGGKMKFTLYVAGTQSQDVLKMVDELVLNYVKEYVNIVILGFKTIEELNKVVPTMHLGINDLAMHRKGILENTSLKTIDFLCWKLPFIIGYNDENLPEKENFFYKVDSDETGIDIDEVVQFVKMSTSRPINTKLYVENVDLKSKLARVVSMLKQKKCRDY